MPTFVIDRTSDWDTQGGYTKDKMVTPPVLGAYIKERESYTETHPGPWYYWAIDLEWDKLPEFIKKVDTEIVLSISDTETLDLEIYDAYRE